MQNPFANEFLSLEIPSHSVGKSSLDSCAHFFAASTHSEAVLDRYMSVLVASFLGGSSGIHAAPASTARFHGIGIPEKTADTASVAAYLSVLRTQVVDGATRTAAPRMVGHMATALPYFHRPLARLLVALNQNMVKVETAATFTLLERQTLGMLHNAFYANTPQWYRTHLHSPEHCLGLVCSGGTVANITALWTARNAALCATKGFGGVDREGLAVSLLHHRYKGAVVIGSQLLHYSFRKAVDLLGLGENNLRLIPTDQHDRIRTDLLQHAINEYKLKQYLVVACVGIAGTTEFGSIDDLQKMGAICKQAGVHFHVDAAWGGPLIFSQENAHKLVGIELADSITVDGHKQLYTPMGLGILLFKSPSQATSICKTANYVIRATSMDLGKFTLEGSRPANILYLHASLSILGLDGLSVLTTRSCTLVRQLYTRLKQHPSMCFDVIHEPQSNILLYRYLPSPYRTNHNSGLPPTPLENSLYNTYVVTIQERMSLTDTFVSRTKAMRNGHWIDVFRVVVANPLTQWADLEACLMMQIEIGACVEREFENRRNAELVNRQNAELVMGKYGQIDEWWPGWPFDI